MDITDFNAPFEDDEGHRHEGLCATVATHEGEEVVLSQQFNRGTQGVRLAVNKVLHANSADGTIPMRYHLIQTMVEQEARFAAVDPTMRVTGKGGGAITSIKRELGMRRQMPRRFAPVVLEGVLNLARLQLIHNDEQHG
jgi:hypothetical protein